MAHAYHWLRVMPVWDILRTLLSSPLDKLSLDVNLAISGDSNICVGTGSLLSPFSFRPASVLVLEDDDEEEEEGATSPGVAVPL